MTRIGRSETVDGIPAADARILVTGGFGFLGSHILQQLCATPLQRLHVVDNLTSNPIDVDVLLEELGRPKQLTYDLCSVAEYLRDGPECFDVVIHLASVVGPAGVLRHGGRIVGSIVDDTYLLADYALDVGARLLDVSTSEVYGGGRNGLCAETDPKVVPALTSFRLEYAVGKLAAETALLNLHQRDGLDAVIVRPFNIAGPRQSGEGGFVLPRFIAQAHLGLPLTIFGTGQARRAFSHVADVADGIIRAALHGVGGTAYNIGNHRNVVTVEGLADQVLDVTDSPSSKAFVDPSDLYGPHFVEANDKFPAAGRATQELNWAPTRDVDQIVQDTWAYMAAAASDTFARLAGRKVIEQLLEAQARRVMT